MNNTAMINKPTTIKRPCKVIVVDESITKIVFKSTVSSVPIEDEGSEKNYRITRTPVKKGLQMTGDY